MIGYIYKIKCYKTGEFYIGSTNNIKNRYRQHKQNYNTCLSKKIINNNFYIFSIIDKREFPNKLSIMLLENIYILIGKKTKKCINKNLSYRTKEVTRLKNNGRYKNNLENNLINAGKYRNKNREKINQKAKTKKKCDICGSFINTSCISRHKKTKKCIQSRLLTPPIIL